MAIENGFSHHKICDYIFNFDVIELEDWKFLITNF
jgi:hypothetical protein